jgi:hypothetical protein
MSIARRVGTVIGILVLDLPVSFLLTIMLLPLWSTIERRWGIESVGHSGPATWCFVTVYACAAAIGLGTYFARTVRRTAVAADRA